MTRSSYHHFDYTCPNCGEPMDQDRLWTEGMRELEAEAESAAIDAAEMAWDLKHGR